MEVFIVHMETGEYEDHRETIAGVFDSQVKAELFADEKRARLEKLGLHADGNDSNRHDNDLRYTEKVNEEFGSIDYTGAWYSISGPFEVQ